MKINLFKMIVENKVEYDERICEDKKDIQILMLLLVKVAFVVTLIIDCCLNTHFEENVPILYYTIMLEMTIEPLLRCLKGAFDNPKEFILSIVIGCMVAGTSTYEMFKNIFSKQILISVGFCIIIVIVMYFVYTWAYNYYLKKQQIDSQV